MTIAFEAFLKPGVNLSFSGLEASNWIALDGASGGEDSTSQSDTQIRPVKRIVVHPRAKSYRGFFQNDLVIRGID